MNNQKTRTKEQKKGEKRRKRREKDLGLGRRSRTGGCRSATFCLEMLPRYSSTVTAPRENESALAPREAPSDDPDSTHQFDGSESGANDGGAAIA